MRKYALKCQKLINKDNTHGSKLDYYNYQKNFINIVRKLF